MGQGDRPWGKLGGNKADLGVSLGAVGTRPSEGGIPIRAGRAQAERAWFALVILERERGRATNKKSSLGIFCIPARIGMPLSA